MTNTSSTSSDIGASSNIGASADIGLARSRASAYDEVYASNYHPKRVTIESFDRSTRFILDAEADDDGHPDGNEIRHALNLVGVDHLQGKRILDYCCGAGRTSIYFALLGAEVHAFDASADAIRIAKESARLSGVDDKIVFAVLDAQALPYPSATFDAAFCQSALHIIVDYARAASELARVLKGGGRAVFCEEPLGHNPALELVRWWRRRKYRRCGGRTLRYEDILGFGRPFEFTRIHHFNLLSQVKTFLGHRARHRYIKPFLRVLYRVDEGLLRVLPPLKRFCGKVVVEYVARGA